MIAKSQIIFEGGSHDSKSKHVSKKITSLITLQSVEEESNANQTSTEKKSGSKPPLHTKIDVVSMD